jgi:hypothetical protein
MLQKLNFKESLKEFEIAVTKLSENPVLENALDANIRSLKIMDLFYKEESNEIGSEYAKCYNQLVCLCLKEFREMMPKLNGQAIHVELYSEQMRGRINLMDNIYHRN